jgi:hypothetical protein
MRDSLGHGIFWVCRHLAFLLAGLTILGVVAAISVDLSEVPEPPAILYAAGFAASVAIYLAGRTFRYVLAGQF